MFRPRVLVLADICNPEWPSLPIVGYKYARALAKVADITLVTHVRNRENIEKAQDLGCRVHYIDNEWLAGPMYRLASKLRGGAEVAFSIDQMMSYPPYLAFEYQVWRAFGKALKAGEYDLIHRITPMTPTLPSWIAGRGKVPFVIGPLNGNLDWPQAFRQEQKRERETLRKLRNLYKILPYSKRTFRKADAIFASFSHTINDLPSTVADRIVPMPEVGYDRDVFHAENRRPAFSGGGPYRFLYAGRLVPYKLPEVAIRAFAQSPLLRQHILHVVGDGPELPRLQAMVKEHGAEDRVIFEGRKSQAEVAAYMRDCDAFIFPSIRELGAGVVIEAMASAIPCFVVNYGAPGDLTAQGRGVQVEMADIDALCEAFRIRMEHALRGGLDITAITATALDYARSHYDWDRKAEYTIKIYDELLSASSARR